MNLLMRPKSEAKPDSMERTLNRVNQTQLAEEFGVTKKTLTGHFGKQRTSSRDF